MTFSRRYRRVIVIRTRRRHLSATSRTELGDFSRLTRRAAGNGDRFVEVKSNVVVLRDFAVVSRRFRAVNVNLNGTARARHLSATSPTDTARFSAFNSTWKRKCGRYSERMSIAVVSRDLACVSRRFRDVILYFSEKTRARHLCAISRTERNRFSAFNATRNRKRRLFPRNDVNRSRFARFRGRFASFPFRNCEFERNDAGAPSLGDVSNRTKAIFRV